MDPRDVLTMATTPPNQVLRYGPESDQVADVRIPATAGKPPLVLVVHGGYWRAAFDRSHVAPACQDLTVRGYATCALEYRRIGQAGGGWPGTFTDVAAAIDALPAQLGDRVDLERVGLLGHSAGAHLALWAASAHRIRADVPGHRERPIPVRGVVALSGVCDLGAASDLALSDNAVGELLGGDPRRQPARYAAADPMRLLPTSVRTVLLHGDADDRVPIKLSRDYAAAASANGDDVDLREISGAGHFDVIDPRSRAWPHVLRAVADLLK